MSSLLSPFGSRGCGMSARGAAEGEAMRDVGSDRGLVPRNLIKRPFPFPRASRLAWSSSLDDEGKGCRSFRRGARALLSGAPNVNGTRCCGRGRGVPPAAPSAAAWCFPMNVTESSVRVGFVEGENESVSPVIETASVIVTVRRIACVVSLDGKGSARRWRGQDSIAG